MAPDVRPARDRLDEVEAGLDAIEAALARLDAGEVDEPVAEAADDEVPPVAESPDDEVPPLDDDLVDELPSDDPAEPDTSW